MDKRMVKRLSRFVVFAILASLVWVMTAFVPAKRPDLIFSHKKHQKRGFECLTCHAQVTQSTSGEDNNLPEMDVCMECHDGTTASDECATCHVDPDSAKPVKRVTTYQKLFSHKQHLAQNIACTLCHPKIEKVDLATMADLPKMKRCLRCHQVEEAPDDCKLCHEVLKEKTPKSHLNNWLHLHQQQAKEKQRDCAGCHRQDFCQRCHQGDNLEGRIHNLNYLYNHSLDARAKEATCISCHESREFCADCHRQHLVMPISHSKVNWANNISGNGGQHKMEAQQDLESCVACHETEAGDPICADCHKK